MKKRTYMMILLGALSVFSFIYFCFSTKVLLPSKVSPEITQVLYQGESVTEYLDEKILKEKLADIRMRRSLKRAEAYRQEDYPVEIDLMNNGKPFHLLLGENSIGYEAVGKNVWKLTGTEGFLLWIESELSDIVTPDSESTRPGSDTRQK